MKPGEEWRVEQETYDCVLTFGEGYWRFGFPLEHIETVKLVAVVFNAQLDSQISSSSSQPQVTRENKEAGGASAESTDTRGSKEEESFERNPHN